VTVGDLARVVGAAPVAELVVRGGVTPAAADRGTRYAAQLPGTSAHGAPPGAVRWPRVAPVVPLVLDDAPALALPYSELELADAIAASGTISLVLSDPRGTGNAWRPLVAALRVAVEPDPEGERTVTSGLIDQETRKHLLTKRLAGSLMARQERWWYLARLIVRTTRVLEVRPIPPRDPRDAVLVTTDDVQPVGVTDWHRDELTITPLGDGTPHRSGGGLRPGPPRTEDERGGPPGATHAPPTPTPGPAVLFTHDRSLPDGERRTECRLHGTYRNGRFLVEERHGTPELPRWRLATSWRAHRRLERACRAGLRAARP
jgi:hypothetical protein